MAVTRNSLFRSMMNVSTGDRSVLEAVYATNRSDIPILATSPDSANIQLWSEMVEFGWMTRL